MDVLPGYITGIFAVLLLSAFAKIVTVLSILRYGIGLRGAGFGAVVAGLAFALALLVMAPQVEKLGGLDAVLAGQISGQSGELERIFRPFLERHAEAGVVRRMSAAHAAAAANGESAGVDAAAPVSPETVSPELASPAAFSVLIAAFLISELQEAFQLGFIILVPFLVIDLLVANIMLALGVAQMPLSIAALPLKILLFIAVDGWALISEKLLNAYL